jgi:hypothetical protein
VRAINARTNAGELARVVLEALGTAGDGSGEPLVAASGSDEEASS